MTAAAATFVVDRNGVGLRLGALLEARWPEVARPFLRRLVRAGQVRINGVAAAPQARVQPGDEISIESDVELREWPRFERPAAPPELPILAESDWCLVVAKPAGIPSVPDRAGKEAGVYGLLRELRPDDDLRIAHRLDRDTSGCLVIAKGLAGARWLDEVFREGRAEKHYTALIEGQLGRDHATVRRAIGPDPRRPGRLIAVPEGTKKSRSAHTEIDVTERFTGYTLLDVRPLTGRSHQIRVHLRSLGHPIVADRDYGGEWPLLLSAFKRDYKPRRGVAEHPLLERTFLHSRSVVVPSPDGGSVAATAPLPRDLESVLAKLRRFAPPEESPCV